MDLTLIKKLIKIVESSEINDLSLEEGGIKISISKGEKNFVQALPQQINIPSTTASTSKNSTNEIILEKKAEFKSDKIHEIKSPIVGTFYRAPAPDADPYVQVGDHISVGTVLCIVEAMKLMNEIESDISGKVIKILVENGTPVEYNQPMFLIEKD